MGIARRWSPLTPRTVSGMPVQPGVYELGSQTSGTRKYGMATNLRRRVRQQLGDAELVRWRLSPNPQCDEARLIAGYKTQHGRLPPGNKQEPSVSWCEVQDGAGDTNGGLLAVVGVVAALGLVAWLSRRATPQSPRYGYWVN